jgi:membrane dipeptidase
MRHAALAAAALGVAAAAVPARAQQSEADLLARARRIHAQTPLVDGHNDLPWEIREKAGGDLARLDPRRSNPAQHTDIPRLRAGAVGGVFWAAYVPSDYAKGGAARVALEQIDLIHRMTAASPDLRLALTADDVERAHREGKIASLIGIEGGHAIENSLGTLRQFHEVGVRYLTLTHASTLDWADAATDSARHGGLTRFGEEVVREMNRMGMLVDLSHVSPATMTDALRVSVAPVIFSHSSARALADHPRNVPDDVLRLLRGNGGMVMVNFYSGFVDPAAARVMRQMFDVQRRFRDENPGNPEAARAAYRAWQRQNPVPRGSHRHHRRPHRPHRQGGGDRPRGDRLGLRRRHLAPGGPGRRLALPVPHRRAPSPRLLRRRCGQGHRRQPPARHAHRRDDRRAATARASGLVREDRRDGWGGGAEVGGPHPARSSLPPPPKNHLGEGAQARSCAWARGRRWGGHGQPRGAAPTGSARRGGDPGGGGGGQTRRSAPTGFGVREGGSGAAQGTGAMNRAPTGIGAGWEG